MFRSSGALRQVRELSVGPTAPPPNRSRGPRKSVAASSLFILSVFHIELNPVRYNEILLNGLMLYSEVVTRKKIEILV